MAILGSNSIMVVESTADLPSLGMAEVGIIAVVVSDTSAPHWVWSGVSWSNTATGSSGTIGPQGNTGPPGPMGNTGTDGAPGPKGDVGLQGNTGSKGDVGPQGNTGSKGDPGPQGNTGSQGPIGNTGAQGIQGSTGSQGIRGNTGSQGIQGTTGVTGSTGSQGIQGNTGTVGSTGSQGIQGNTGLQGNTGSQGIQGNTGPSGSSSDPWTYVKLANTFNTSSASAVNILGLSFAPQAGKSYDFYAMVLLRTTSATVNPRLGLAWATGLSDGVAMVNVSQAATGNPLSASGNPNANLLTAVGGLPNTTQSWPGYINGMATAGAAPSGFIACQLASETAGTTVSCMAGSFVSYRII